MGKLNCEADRAYCITSEENIRYLTGFSGDYGVLAVLPDEQIFFTDARYLELARREMSGIQVRESRTPFESALEQIRHRTETIALELDKLQALRYMQASGLFRRIEDAGPKLAALRCVKTPEEIEKIKAAARATQQVMVDVLPQIREGIREQDLLAEIIYLIYRQGMKPSFAPVVASGENAAIPHATPSMRKFKAGDFLTLDFGAASEGYCADMTRTFAIGNIDAEQKRIYDIVRNVQQSAQETCADGIACADVDAHAREMMGEYAPHFTHGLGHGVGLRIHEAPTLNASSKDVLKTGMVFTIEPGIYIPGAYGVRIENTCIVGEGSLFDFTKELIIF